MFGNRNKKCLTRMEKRESKEVGGRMFVALLFLVTGKRTRRLRSSAPGLSRGRAGSQPRDRGRDAQHIGPPLCVPSRGGRNPRQSGGSLCWCSANTKTHRVHRGKTCISLKHSQTPEGLENGCWPLKSRGDLSYIEIFLNLHNQSNLKVKYASIKGVESCPTATGARPYIMATKQRLGPRSPLKPTELLCNNRQKLL